MRLKAGENYRFRIINITALGPTLVVSLLLNDKPVNWRQIAKDGADLPIQQCITKEAFKQPVSIGETMDFQFKKKEPGDYVFEVRGGISNTLFASKVIIIK